MGCPREYLCHARLAQAPSWRVNDSLYTLCVIVVERRAQVREHVLYLLALKKADSKDLVGQASREEGFFHRAGLEVGAVEHGNIPRERLLAPDELPGLLGNSARLASFVKRRNESDFFPYLIFGKERFVPPLAVLLNNLVCRCDNSLG